jgi:hypothetical protein
MEKIEYKIVSVLNNKAIEYHSDNPDYKKGNLVMWDQTDCANQIFFFEQCPDPNFYIIRSKVTGKVLDVTN